MPQMKPMNWLLLMLYILYSFLLINNNLYFYFFDNIYNKNLFLKNNQFNFNW